MKGLLGFAQAVDKLNEWVGRIAIWAMFISCMVSAGNATIRYLVSRSSNSWLEVQWYLFAVTVMFGTAHVLKVNEHVRVDVLYGRLAPRTKALIDLFGFIVFLLPGAVLIAWMAWPWFVESFVNNEMSSNAGGLVRWPMKIVIPIGFFLLALQGVSEAIKRVGYLRGVFDMDVHYERPLQ